MADFTLIGGRMEAPMSYERFLDNVQSMLLLLPDYPNGHWTRWVPGDDPTAMDNVAVDVRDPRSVAAAIEVTSRQGNAWKLECQRHAGNRVYPLRVSIDAEDGWRTWIVLDLHGMPDQDSARVRATLDEYLHAGVDAWNPTWFKVGTTEFHQAQKSLGLEHGQVVLGWETYISNEVSLDASKLNDHVSVTTYSSGKVLRLAGSPYAPSMEAAQVVRNALGYECRAIR